MRMLGFMWISARVDIVLNSSSPISILTRAKPGTDASSNILESELHQYVNIPKRNTNILDLLLSTCEDFVTDLKMGLEFSTSDHRLVTFKVTMKNEVLNRSNEKGPDFRSADFVKLINLVANSD